MDKDVNAQDALHMEIGRIAQAHVYLDWVLRQVYVALATPSPAMFLVNETWSTNALIRTCSAMLKRAQTPDHVVRAGLSVLEAATEANGERNRVVHDMWLPDFEDLDSSTPTSWNLTKIARGSFGSRPDGTHDLKSVEGARLQIYRASIRVSGLHWALLETLPFYQHSGATELVPLSNWIAVMEDHFTLDDDGGFRIDNEGA